MKQTKSSFRVLQSALICALSIALLSGCAGNKIRREVEKGIAKVLPEKIGPAKSYDVKVWASTMKILDGKLDSVDIVGKDVKLPNGLKLAELDVTVKDIRFDPRSREVKSCGETTYSATLSEEELGLYLKRTFPDVPALAVDLKTDRIGVAASPSMTGIRVNIKAEATLDIEKQRFLTLGLRKVTVAGVPTPGFARDYIATKVNPVFDADEIGFDAKISSAKIKDEAVTLTGDLNLMKALAGDKPAKPDQTMPKAPHPEDKVN